jgi:hypothetical protein
MDTGVLFLGGVDHPVPGAVESVAKLYGPKLVNKTHIRNIFERSLYEYWISFSAIWKL